MKILIMGLSGTGKTTLAADLVNELHSVEWFNADDVRKFSFNWDFSTEGRITQAITLKRLADNSTSEHTVTDFIAPTDLIRQLFAADLTIWMNTKDSSQYKDTDKLFQAPVADIVITDFNYCLKDILERI